MNYDQRTMPNILCCICGALIPANPANMCVNCVRNQVDITDGIPKNLILQFCRGCERYLQPPAIWVVADLESRQLLALCLKRIKGLNKVRLIDAGFVWTEPHSKRVKVKLSIQKEVLNGTILQQSFIVEFVVNHLMCPDCHQTEAKLTWKAVAQVRQKVDHKRTFYWLEQLILKHNAHNHCLNIKEMHDGIDFFFANKTHAQKFVDFVATVTPIRQKTSKELISHDVHEDTYNYKFTISVEIAPPCKDDLVCFPKGIANSLGNISPIVICVKMSTSLHFLNPFTLQSIELTANNYWKNPFRSISSRDRLVKFIILDINLLGPTFGKNALAEAVIARESDFGRNDIQFTTVTHLGNLLKPGDFALGYDLNRMNFNDKDISSLRGAALPDIMLVRKDYRSQQQKKKRRKWRLTYLLKEEEESKRKHDADRAAKEHEEFLQDLEEDPELWQQVNLYKDARDNSSSDVSESEDDLEFPGPKVTDLISDIQKLSINDMDIDIDG